VPILTPEERIGTTLDGRYRLDALLGQGGMGDVFAGAHVWTGRPVAVKLMVARSKLSDVAVQRFLREARTAAALRHRHVVDVLDMGRAEDGALFLVFERLEGPTLQERLEERGPMPPAEAWRLLRPIMRALATAHDRGLVHRDVKPDNVLLHEEDGETVPKLLDFGVVRMMESEEASLTDTGIAIGTPSFMAPEQVRGQRDVGPPADVWSMALMFHYCMTGRAPFDGPTPMAIMTAVLTQPPPSFAATCPELPTALTEVLDRGLVAQESDRHPDMGAFLAALDAASEHAAWPKAPPTARVGAPTLIAASSGAPGAPLSPPVRRGPLVAVAVAALALAGTAVSVWVAHGPPSSSSPELPGSADPAAETAAAPVAERDEHGPMAEPDERASEAEPRAPTAGSETAEPSPRDGREPPEPDLPAERATAPRDRRGRPPRSTAGRGRAAAARASSPEGETEAEPRPARQRPSHAAARSDAADRAEAATAADEEPPTAPPSERDGSELDRPEPIRRGTNNAPILR
jgi:serine/threonine-protein kinase